MPIAVKCRDETPGAQSPNHFELEFPTERVRVRELIRSRVYQDVKDHNVRRAQEGRTTMLVTPTEAEADLNGPTKSTGRDVDWRRQFEVALDAFERRSFMLLVDDRQAESLDDEVELTHGTEVTFLRLVPLVGG